MGNLRKHYIEIFFGNPLPLDHPLNNPITFYGLRSLITEGLQSSIILEKMCTYFLTCRNNSKQTRRIKQCSGKMVDWLPPLFFQTSGIPMSEHHCFEPKQIQVRHPSAKMEAKQNSTRLVATGKGKFLHPPYRPIPWTPKKWLAIYETTQLKTVKSPIKLKSTWLLAGYPNLTHVGTI